jgi:hypothetical protein
MNKKILNRFENNLTYDSTQSGKPTQHVIGENLYDSIVSTLTDGTSFGQKLETVCTEYIFPYLQEINSQDDVAWGYKNFPFGDAVCSKGNSEINDSDGSDQEIVLYSIKATGTSTSTDGSDGNVMVTSQTKGTTFVGGTRGDVACKIIYDHFNDNTTLTPPKGIYPGGVFVTVSLPATAEIGYHGICLIITKIDPSNSAKVDAVSVNLNRYANQSANPNPPTSSPVTTVKTWQTNIDSAATVNTTYHVIYPNESALQLSEDFKDKDAANISTKSLQLYKILIGGPGAESGLQMIDTKDNSSILNRLNKALRGSELSGASRGGPAGQNIRDAAVLEIRRLLRTRVLSRLGGYTMLGATDPDQAAQVVNDKLPGILEVLSKNMVDYLDRQSLEKLIGTDVAIGAGGGTIDFNVVVFSSITLDELKSKLEDALSDLKTLEYTAQGTQSTPDTQAEKDAYLAGLRGVPKPPRGGRIKESKEYPYEIKLQDLLDMAVEVAVNFFEDLGFAPSGSTEKKPSWLDSLKGFGSDVAGAVDTAVGYLDDILGVPGTPAMAENNHKKYSLLDLLEEQMVPMPVLGAGSAQYDSRRVEDPFDIDQDTMSLLGLLDADEVDIDETDVDTDLDGIPNRLDDEDDTPQGFGDMMERFLRNTHQKEDDYKKEKQERQYGLSHAALLKKKYYGRY